VAKIVPSDRLRRELDELLSGVGEHNDPVEAVARLGARLIIQQALEDEVTEFLGCERYERGDGDAAIYRNGYEPRVVKTTSGPSEVERRVSARAFGRHGRQHAGGASGRLRSRSARRKSHWPGLAPLGGVVHALLVGRFGRLDTRGRSATVAHTRACRDAE
jgi:hypothetical protein